MAIKYFKIVFMQTCFSSIWEPSYMDQKRILLKSAKILPDKHNFPQNKLENKFSVSSWILIYS